ncbi:MAG: hypothetical protein OIN87_08055 [Candidatus Methanoperedens sp.]|nr:hypothetical protein [Candidatus Methanoperedens sp.]
MNIKIVICFIIIFLLLSASPGAADKVWVAKSSGSIGSNGSIAFENYLVKAKVQSPLSSSLTIYKNTIEIEKKDFKVNEFAQNDSIRITLLGVYGSNSWIAISKLEEKTLWIPSGNTTLKWGDTYSYENYSIGLDSLGKDSVTLSISGENTTVTDIFMKDDAKDYDNMHLVVTEINRTGFIEIEFFKYNIPVIDGKIITDKEEYDPDEIISVSISITGEKTINIARITLNSTNLGSKTSEFTAFGINGTRSFTSKIEGLSPDSIISITSTIEVRDYKNIAYFSTINKEVSVKPFISIEKRIQEETDEDKVQVELVVYNSGLNPAFVHIHDNVSDTNPKQMDWDIELRPKNSSNISYFINPQKPGTYQLPAATAQWNGKTSLSNTVIMNVHMPYIRMIKTAVKNKGMIEVELEIINSGDRPSNVVVNDKIPAGNFLANGNDSWSGFLDAGKKTSIRYTLKGNSSTLPAADATYRDILGTVRYAQSNAVEIKNIAVVGSKKVDTTSLNAGWSEMMIFMILSFVVISFIIGIVAFAAYLITKNKMRAQ